MGKGSQLTPMEQGFIKPLAVQGFSPFAISKKTKTSKDDIQHSLKDRNQCGTTYGNPGNTKMSLATPRFSLRETSTDDLSASALQASLSLPIQPPGSQQILSECKNLQYKKYRCIPPLTADFKNKRMNRAQKIHARTRTKLGKVIFSDQKQIKFD